ncbi:MAG: LysM peptidoglycan-binding domain-containing protein [Chloroflexi bacterium]|nr:LysM peptidoglycan-binding domain-containing protein [Chloroflexota bacterium]MBP8057146.1 LysM peptidoglycan-binding domain-containing protein [Chloroflexota bacterium]
MTELAAADVIEVAAAQPTEYTVVSGDNLSAIAQNLYGDANRWRDIYEANKKTIGANPSAIRVGMVLVIPQ